MKILSTFSHRHVVLNLNEFLSSVDHKKGILNKWQITLKPTDFTQMHVQQQQQQQQQQQKKSKYQTVLKTHVNSK